MMHVLEHLSWASTCWRTGLTVTKSLCPRTAVNRLRCRRTNSDLTANRGVRRAVSLWSTSSRPSFGFPAPSLDFELLEWKRAFRVESQLASMMISRCPWQCRTMSSIPRAVEMEVSDPSLRVWPAARAGLAALLQPVPARPSWRLLPSAASVSTKRILCVASAHCRIWSVKRIVRTAHPRG